MCKIKNIILRQFTHRTMYILPYNWIEKISKTRKQLHLQLGRDDYTFVVITIFSRQIHNLIILYSLINFWQLKKTKIPHVILPIYSRGKSSNKL